MLEPNERFIAGYEQRYIINTNGEVFSLLGGSKKSLKLSLNTKGYPSVGLFLSGKGKTYTVHSLVAAAFIGLRPNGYQIDHKDGNKLNNISTNIEYVTGSENINRSYVLGLQCRKGEKNGRSKLTIEDVQKIRSDLKSGITATHIARIYNVHNNCIYKIKYGVNWASLQEAV